MWQVDDKYEHFVKDSYTSILQPKTPCPRLLDRRESIDISSKLMMHFDKRKHK